MLTIEQLCGLDQSHVVQVNAEQDGIRLQQTVADAYLAMRSAAAEQGISIAIASGFRDFERQRVIWNKKFAGLLPLYNDRGEELVYEQLSTGEKIEAILTWSALPGASRHHWGTDYDVYDPQPFLEGQQQLQLIPAEYEPSGPCHKMYQWLRTHARDFGFFFPYARYQGGVAAEPWHLSHLALARQAQEHLTLPVLKAVLESENLEGKAYILEQMSDIKLRYIDNICPATIDSGDAWFG